MSMAKVYLDSCMIIGLIEGDATLRQTLRRQLCNHLICCSELSRLKARVLAIRNDDAASLQQFDQFFAACEMVTLNRAVFDQSALLRAKSNLKTPDALHLAAAIHASCEEFWSDDKQLNSVASRFMSVVDWEKLDALK
ncbi:MAG: PIN domain-containing protein [Sideroxyarcus sp.]|nr:PIN domain-containing protein [Sideroxyarcus sp.]